jgi:hypothetical protein
MNSRDQKSENRRLEGFDTLGHGGGTHINHDPPSTPAAKEDAATSRAS